MGRCVAVVAVPLAMAAACTGIASTAAGAAAPTATVVGQPVPSGTGTLEAVSCGSSRDCWAVGLALDNVLDAPTSPAPGPSTVVIDATADGGATWRPETVNVTDPTNLTDIACPDRHHCMAVGTADGNGALSATVLVTSDGGRIWRSMDAPAGSTDLSAVTCSTVGDCLVLASNGTAYWSASTTDGGKVWQRNGTLPAGFSGPSAVICPDTETCMTAGYVPGLPGRGTGAIAVTDDGGTTWAAATVPAGVGLLHSIACASTLYCLAVGTTSTTLTDVAEGHGEMLATTDGGNAWTAVTAPAGVDDAFGIACPSMSNCAAVGTEWTSANSPVGGVVTTTDAGGTWRAPASRYVPAGLDAVDCPTTTSCVAAGNDVLARVVLPAPKRRR